MSFAAAEKTEAYTPTPPVIIELRIKSTVTKPFTLGSVDTDSTVAEMKVLCQTHCAMPVEQQRLLYKGRLLQDSQTLEEASVQNLATLFLVQGACASPQSKGGAVEAEPQRGVDSNKRGPREGARSTQTPMCIECGANPQRLQTAGLCGLCWREQVVEETRELKRRCEEARRRAEEENNEEARRRQKVIVEEGRRAEELLQHVGRQQDTSRCHTCQKKIGLTGFQCQCSHVYCATHRYAEDHACTFDHAAHGRELLAQQVCQAARGSSSA